MPVEIRELLIQAKLEEEPSTETVFTEQPDDFDIEDYLDLAGFRESILEACMEKIKAYLEAKARR